MLHFVKNSYTSFKDCCINIICTQFIHRFFIGPQMKFNGHYIIICIAMLLCASSIQAQKVFQSENFKSGTHQELLNELTNYQVFGIDEKAISKYIDKDAVGAEFRLSFNEDLNFDIYLFERNIFMPDHVVTTTDDNGQLQDVEIAQRAKTYYGYLPDKLNSEVALTIADGFLYGFINDGTDNYFIQPEIDWVENSTNFILYNENDVKENDEISCGITLAHQHKKESIEPPAQTENESCLTVPYAIANDYSIFVKYGSVVNVMNRNIGVVNNVNVNYRGFFSSDLEFLITQQVIISSAGGDPWTSSLDPYVLLPNFASWGTNGFTQTFVDASLWTNRDFIDDVVGLAYIEAVCGPYNYNVLQDYTSSAQSIRDLTVHELGHNLGAIHDAEGSPYIMAPTLGNSNSWSSASINAINAKLATVSCLPSCNQPCLQPTGLSESSITQTSATLVWNQMLGSSSYKVQYKAASSSTWSTATYSTGATSITISNLSSGTQYQWRVRSNCVGGISTYAINGFVTSVNCNPPTGLFTSNMTVNSAKLNWTGSPVASTYLVQFKKSSVASWSTYSSGTTSTSVTLTGLSSSTAYDWRVRSNCSGGHASSLVQTSFSTQTPCNAPTGLSESSITQTSATLVWNQMLGSSSYRVQYKAASSSTWLTATYSTAATSINISNLTSGTQYQWRVRSNCVGGISTYAINGFVTSVNCNPPSGLFTSNMTVNSAKLNWTGSPVASTYLVQYKKSSVSSWSTYSSGTTSTSVTLTGLSSSTAYDWRVRSNCSGGQVSSLIKTSFLTQTPCGRPSGASTTNISTTSAKLNWTSVFDAASYRVEYKKSNVSAWTVATNGINNLNINISNLSQNTNYNWRVRANCSSGLLGSYVTRNFTTLTPCNAPSNPNELYVNSINATVAWYPASGAQSYRLEYKKASSSSWTLSASALNATSKTIVGLDPSTSYDWRVRSNCSGGQTSQYSTSGFVTTDDCSPPTGLSASNITANSVKMFWTQSSSASSYRTEYKKNTSSQWLLHSIANIADYRYLYGLEPGIMYNYRIRSNCDGNATSNYVYKDFVTSSCNAPSYLYELYVNSINATVGWYPASGAQSYRLEYKKASSSSWTLSASALNVTSNTIVGLDPSTSYNWRVSSNCSSGQPRQYSTSGFVTTDDCNPPTGLSAFNITASSARIHWIRSSSASSYRTEYKKNTSSQWLLHSSAATGDNRYLYGLDPGIMYNYRIRSNCGSTATSNYVYENFVTSSCTAPQNLSTTELLPTSVRINWSSVPQAQAYSIQYKKSTSSSWINGGTISGLYRYLGGLEPQTTYIWRVKSICTGESSGFSNNNSFTTPIASYCISFEGNMGGFVQSTTDDTNWSRASDNGTSSAETGPSEATDGYWFTFIESSAPYHPDKEATITSPNFDILSTQGNLEFDWHMYGSGMGQLNVFIKDVSTGQMVLKFTKQNDQGDTWNSEAISLSEYSGKTIQVVLQGITGNTWRSDMAVDNICLNYANYNSGFSPVLEDRDDIVLEEKSIGELSIYPNPASKVLYVEWENEHEGEALIQIFNASGKLVYSNQIFSDSNFYKMEIQLTEYVDGLYYLSVREGTIAKTKKFVVR